MLVSWFVTNDYRQNGLPEARKFFWLRHRTYLRKEKLNATQEEFEQIEAVWADVTAKSKALVDQLNQDLANKDASNLANRSEALKLLKSQLRDVSETNSA